MSQIAIIARVSLTADSVSQYVEAAKAVIEPTRKEDGCEFYAMGVDITDPTKVWISEQWASQEALNAHLQSDHIKTFLGKLATIELLDMDARQYDVANVGPVVLPE